ncbi:MAG: hypothetical protein NWF14_07765, partial [Candidatus Bathyarchaeota archaeon]|nr:hypothetical protein [Candidatus Bathyarchaeota archaeon]
KVVRIKNTQELERLWVSESLYKMAKANPKLEVGGEPEEMSFDASGNLARQKKYKCSPYQMNMDDE